MRRHAGAAAANQEVEVATFVGLQHVLDIELAVAAAVGRHALLPCTPLGEARLAAWRAQQQIPATNGAGGGYRKLYVEHVLQADEGCDFDFLVGCRGAEVPRHSH